MDKGRKIKKYGRKIGATVVTILSGLVNLAVGGFLLWGVIPTIGTNGVSFSGDISLLNNIAYGLILGGVVFFLVAVFLYKPKYTFTLYENAIECHSTSGNRTDFFSEMEALLIFTWRGFAYRSNNQEQWIHVNGKTGKKIAGINNLTKKLKNMQVNQRLEKVFHKYADGENVKFEFFKGGLHEGFMFGNMNLDEPKVIVEISRGEFRIDNQMSSISQIKIDNNAFNAQIIFEDNAGEKICQVHPMSMVSGALFIELVQKIQGSEM